MFNALLKFSPTKIIAALTQKYGMPFTFVEFSGGSLGHPSSRARVSCEACPKARLYAEMVEENGESVCRDNVMAYMLQGDVQAALQGAVRNVYPDAKCLALPANQPQPAWFSPAMDIEAYLRDSGADIRGIFFTAQPHTAQERADASERLRHTLQERGIMAALTIVYVISAALEKVEPEEYLKYLRPGMWKAVGEFRLEDDFSLRTCQWREQA